jgi:hypothetical protein
MKTFTKILLALLMPVCFICNRLQAQNTFPGTGAAGIGTTTPDVSSLLEVKSTTKGLLIPRMTKVQRDAIVSPVEGLMIYQKNSTPGFYYYTGSNWIAVSSKGWKLNGNSGTDGTTNFIGTTDDQSLAFKVNNQKAGLLDYLNYNTGFGFQTLNANISGFENSAYGFQALYFNTTGASNTANGDLALYFNTTGGSNTANGDAALYSNTTGYYNTANGQSSLYSNTTANGNTANGAHTLFANTTGYYNTANGDQGLYQNTTGFYNTACGFNALYNNVAGNYNTALGVGADVTKGDLENAMALGYFATVNSSDKVVVGNNNVTVIGGQVGWSSFSDGRFKNNIKENVPGLAFINKLKPVTYNLELQKFDKFLGKKDSLINSMLANYALAEKKIHTGFVAQDVEKAAQELKYDFDGVNHPQNDKDNYSLVHADFVPSLVKAVQELSLKNDDLQKQIDDLKTIVAGNQNQVMLNAKGQTLNVSSALLEQNIPNPFFGNTVIRYNVPLKANNAQLIISDASGHVLKTIVLSAKGNGQTTITSGTLSQGNYFYSLIIDGKKSGTKQMTVTR